MKKSQEGTLLKRVVLDSEMDHCIDQALTVTVEQERENVEGKIESYSRHFVQISGEQYHRDSCVIRFPFVVMEE
jgi:hypothetical protein